MLQKGATSLWETFLSEPNNSLNHHFFGDISNWFITKVGGITVNPYRKNPNEVHIKPNFISELSYAHAYYTTPAGKVDVKWERADDDIILTILSPEEVTGKIILPSGYEFVTQKEFVMERKNLDRMRETALKEGCYTICKI
ncbi:hypothetical protein SDC9_204007 [bioreactor metagenome]|uniref:alpha-L-rhamnosidase n=1 Tax=bioreactor metagenome TaxID=1076179 RepID=A0A645J0S9_9ZZZZ